MNVNMLGQGPPASIAWPLPAYAPPLWNRKPNISRAPLSSNLQNSPAVPTTINPTLSSTFSNITHTTGAKVALAPTLVGLPLYVTYFIRTTVQVWKSRALHAFPWAPLTRKVLFPFLGPFIIPVSAIFYGAKQGKALTQRLYARHITNPTLSDLLEDPFYKGHQIRTKILLKTFDLHKKLLGERLFS